MTIGKRGGAAVLVAAVAVGLSGCATSTTRSVGALGPIGDRLLLKRETVTLRSSPFAGASIQAEEEYFLCSAVQDSNRVACEKAILDLPAVKSPP